MVVVMDSALPSVSFMTSSSARSSETHASRSRPGSVIPVPRSMAGMVVRCGFEGTRIRAGTCPSPKFYDALKSSLREVAAPFEFSAWQRAVKYRYSLAPLSTKGSLVDPGGRFNIGAIDPSRFPLFPALLLGFR